MDVKEEYFRLKDLWMKSKDLGREDAGKKLEAFMNALSEEDKQLVTEAIAEDFKRIHKVVDESKQLRERIEVRKQLEEVLSFISVSALAKKYFGRSSSWFYQRLNGNEVHGKTAAFTPEEIHRLADALNDIASKLKNAATTFSVPM